MTKKDKFKDYAEERLIISDRVIIGTNYWNKEKYFYRSASLQCPCGSDRFYSEEVICDKKGSLKTQYWSPEVKFAWKLRNHIERQIRLNGCPEHIKILIDILGDEDGLELLELWAKKNIIIGMALKKFIEELRSRRIIRTAEGGRK